MTRVLVCGGRDFRDARKLQKALDTLHDETPFTILIHGGAQGADYLAGLWARFNSVPVKVCTADWDNHRAAAGMIRNKRMLVEGKPDLVIAFRGGAGTSNMITQAIKAGVPVLQIR